MNSIADSNSKRRTFIKGLLSVPVLTSAGIMPGPALSRGDGRKAFQDENRGLKLSLNAFSFNDALLKGTMTIEDMLEFCAEKGLAAVDLTAYYFPGYPKVPADDYLYKIKRKAFSLGVEISGTGVRNDFTHADPAKRQESVQLVKDWIHAAEKLGAQTIRIFSGNQKPEGHSREQILDWMLKDIRECIGYGQAHGVVIALQNHDDFIKTSADTIAIMESLKSDWCGLMLDIGSFRASDPYEEIARTVKYAITWQIKEKVFVNGKEVDLDAPKLVDIIRKSGYRGYLPIEALGQGDPRVKVSALLDKLRRAFNA
ncbi:MAG TPA: sugar phosphate isomerase/epimerase family protein [Chryseosolibacter sp.]